MRLSPPFLALALAACSTSSSDESGVARAGVNGGSKDTTHPAVVALKLTTSGGGYELCSGSIVRVDGSKGTVLTAAHCFDQGPARAAIMLGPDSSKPEHTFTSTSWSIYPRVAGDADHDLAVIEFDGATAGTPVLKLVAPRAYADLPATASYTLVGYGSVVVGGTPSSAIQNTVRNAIALHAVGFEGTQMVLTSPLGSGCYGDSGGALLDTSSGTERLAGVVQGGARCGPDVGNHFVAFYAPEISAWLRSKGLVAPPADGRQPTGEYCATDADCATGACLDRGHLDDGGVLFVCGSPRPTHATCLGSLQCASSYCTHEDGTCAPCPDGARCLRPPSVDAGPLYEDDIADDAGVVEALDAALPEAGSLADAAVEVSTPPRSAADAPVSDGGCRASSSPSSSSAGSALAALALALLGRRRCRSRGASPPCPRWRRCSAQFR